MILTTPCQSCREDITIKSKEITRPHLIDERGESFRLTCDVCANQREYHVNDVVAKASNTMKLIGLTIGASILVVVTIMFWVMGYISTVGIAIGAMIIAASFGNTSTSNVTAFNAYKIRRLK